MGINRSVNRLQSMFTNLRSRAVIDVEESSDHGDDHDAENVGAGAANTNVGESAANTNANADNNENHRADDGDVVMDPEDEGHASHSLSSGSSIPVPS